MDIEHWWWLADAKTPEKTYGSLSESEAQELWEMNQEAKKNG